MPAPIVVKTKFIKRADATIVTGSTKTHTGRALLFAQAAVFQE
jgi:hypothetical protein